MVHPHLRLRRSDDIRCSRLRSPLLLSPVFPASIKCVSHILPRGVSFPSLSVRPSRKRSK
eukprot:5285820-Pyramimonas_sp.AAC.1